MTRAQIIASAEQITKAIESAGISEIANGTKERMTLQDYLLSFKQYNILAEQFSEGALFLEKELGFSQLRDPDPWITMSKQGDLEDDHPLNNLKGVVSTISSIINLLKIKQQDHQTDENKEILTLVVLEPENNDFSSPKRISDSIDSITLLYEACARLQNQHFDDLEVISCDSGKDKLFDFRGSVLLIGAVKELVLSIWERVIFYRNRNLQERISLLTHSLPALDIITEYEMSGRFTTSEGELTRNALIDGVKKFLSSGAVIQEIRERIPFDERSLMALESNVLPKKNGHSQNGYSSSIKPSPPSPQEQYDTPSQFTAPELTVTTNQTTRIEDDLSWDGILEDDLKTLRELIDKTKRSEEEHN